MPASLLGIDFYVYFFKFHFWSLFPLTIGFQVGFFFLQALKKCHFTVFWAMHRQLKSQPSILLLLFEGMEPCLTGLNFQLFSGVVLFVFILRDIGRASKTLSLLFYVICQFCSSQPVSLYILLLTHYFSSPLTQSLVIFDSQYLMFLSAFSLTCHSLLLFVVLV